LQSEQVDQVVGEAVQQQAEGVGQETVAAQPVSAEAVLELFDTVLALTTVVIEGKNLGSTTGAVGDEEAQIGADGGVLGLVADAALVRPAAGAMAEAGEAALRQLRATIAPLQRLLQGLGMALKNRIGRDAESVLNAEELAELVQQRQSKPGIAAQFDRYSGKRGLQARNQAGQHGYDAGVTGGVPRPQPCRQQTTGVALEDQHGVIHVLTIGAVEETELLLAVSGIVGGIDVEQDLAALPHLLATDADEDFQQGIIQTHQVARQRGVLPAAERGLGAERIAQGLVGDDLQHRIVAQTVGVVGVFVSGDDLVDALPQQRQRVVPDAIVLSRIAEEQGQVAGQMMALIEGSQRQQTGVAGDLAASEVSVDGLMTVEGEAQLWYTKCHVWDAPKRCAGFS